MVITPYKHQFKLIKKIKKAFKRGTKNILAQSPTGSGKTVMFSYMASKAAKKGNKVLIITDRFELLSQAGGTMESFKMKPYYISAGVKFIDKRKSVYVAMSQTLRNRIKKPVWINFIKNEIDLIIIDEAHVQEFNHIFENPIFGSKFIVGFTATPGRTGKMTQLAEQYDKLIKGPSIKFLIKNGYLVNADHWDCGKPNLDGVTINRSKGDYVEQSLYERFDNPKLYKGLVKNYNKICPGQKMIVFCCNVEHAIKTTKQLCRKGISAKFLCSKKSAPREPKKWTPASEAIWKEKMRKYRIYQRNVDKYSGDREDLIAAYKRGEFKVLVNVDIATKGFDDPSIEVVCLYRATTSLTLYLQMVGRGGRRSDGKTHFTILDFGGNLERFGPYDMEREWSLWHEAVSEGGVPPMKICGKTASGEDIKGAGNVDEGCERLILASYMICPFCGFKYPKRNTVQEADLKLAAMTDEMGVSIKSKSFKDMSFQELTDYRKIKKHHVNWLYRMLWIRDKEETIREYAKQYKWTAKRIYYVIQYCKTNYNEQKQFP